MTTPSLFFWRREIDGGGTKGSFQSDLQLYCEQKSQYFLYLYNSLSAAMCTNIMHGNSSKVS